MSRDSWSCETYTRLPDLVEIAVPASIKLSYPSETHPILGYRLYTPGAGSLREIVATRRWGEGGDKRSPTKVIAADPSKNLEKMSYQLGIGASGHYCYNVAHLKVVRRLCGGEGETPKRETRRRMLRAGMSFRRGKSDVGKHG